jgi:CheY-like chemotaxis protein
MNLAVNARDAMREGGKLIIETANQEFDARYVRQHAGAKLGHYVMLSVTDTGMGMDSETQAHIFEPFFTTKELGKGTGLGLATVYGVVKQSDGYIWVDSAPGKGASFKVFLPQTTEGAAHPADAQNGVENLTRTETILLAEDSQPLRRLAKSFLEAHGFTVLSACDGADAMRIAESHAGRVHLLVTDVIMPGINGRVLAERLLARDRRMKILYMSGYTDSFIAGHGVLEKGSFLLNKPFTEQALIQKVLEVLGAETHEPAQKPAEQALVRR